MNYTVSIYDHTGKHLQSVLFHRLDASIRLAQCYNEAFKAIVKNTQSDEVKHIKMYGEAGRWSSSNAEPKPQEGKQHEA